MSHQFVDCTHSCKVFCTAIEFAAIREKEAILQFASLRDDCTDPDVRVLLNQLIIERKKSIDLLERTKALLSSKYKIVGEIQATFGPDN